jgi:PGF-pre-PGF domain-containing protein
MKRGLILIAVLLTILMLPLCFTSSNLKLDKQVTEQFGKGNVKVIVVMNDVSKQISSAGISEQKVRHKFSSFNGFSSELSEDEIKQLADNPSVKAIYYDTPVHTALQDSAPLINATLTWTKQVNGINITGKGLSACVIDTGINYSHPDLGNCTNSTFLAGNCSKVIGGWDFVNNDSDPYDDNHHGTHVSGIIAANGKIKGIAPDAMIVSAKAMNGAGSGTLSDILNAMEFCINNSEKYNISVISMSIGDLVNYTGYCDSQDSNPLYVPLINNATSKNISIIVAAGNSGNYTSMSSPACLSGVISVGATNKSDNIAGFSNRNNLTTVLAPGVNINSTYLSASGYALDSGTSMACPHVSGEVLLLQQAKFLQSGRFSNISDIKNLIRNGKNITDSSTGLNYTRIDVYLAYLADVNDTQFPTYTWISKPNISYGLPATINLSATDDNGITVYNITLNSLSYQMNKSGDYYAYVITPANLNNITYNVTFKDAVGNTNITDTVVLQINDTLYPSYSNISYQQSSVYNSSAVNYFNSTWGDNIQLSRVWLVFYLNSTKQSNYTASNVSSMYNVTLTKIPAGNYSFQWFANDTAGNLNYTTDLYNFSILQADPSLNLSFNVSGILYYQDIFVENGTFVNISATASAEGPIILYLNDSRISSGLNLISNRSQVNATVNTTASYNSTQNYSSSSLTRWIYVEAFNLAPRGNLVSPSNNNYTNNKNVTFKINATDATLKNATLYVWNSTITSNYSLLPPNSTNLTGMYNETNWTYNLSDGYYLWNALVYDFSSNGNFLAGNNSFTVDTISPAVSLSYSSLSIYADESASINCTLPSEANLDYLRLYVGGEVKNSSIIPATLTYTHLGSSGIGTYKINCTAMDKAGNSDTKTQTLTVSSRGIITPPSSGGGGITTTAINVTPAIETTQTVQIQADVPANITIPADVAKEGITKITITTLINISSVEINLKKLDSAAAGAGENVYKYFNISAKNLNESSIKNVSIDFEVTQNWISSNNLNKSTVKLKRYKDVWTELNTIQISEDSDKAYFRAETPGFSFFAITAEKNAVPTTPPGEEEPKTSKKMFMIGIVAVLIIALIAFIWYAFLRKKPSE